MGRYGWKNEDGVRGTQGKTIRVDAVCTECDWDRFDRKSAPVTPGAARVAARRHASLHQHRVRTTTLTVRYFEVDR